jgi:DNA polymerase elongation subunit (family B)
MSNFYTDVRVIRGEIYYRGYKDGERVKGNFNYEPTLFIPSNEPSEYKTLFGDNVSPMKFSSIREAKSFIKDYKDVVNFTFYGNTRFEYCYIGDNFPGRVEHDTSLMEVVNFDIEVGSPKSFPEADEALFPIISIAAKRKGKFYIWGTKDYDKKENEVYFHCKDEIDLLEKFITWWERIEPDIITGWNIRAFDVPYLVNRIKNVFGKEAAVRLSPWKLLSDKTDTWFGKKFKYYELVGIQLLDYLQIYKKQGGETENNRLETIAQHELGIGKVENPYDSHYDMWEQDHQMFIEYNVRDVELVSLLEEKKQYLEMYILMACDAKVNYSDVFRQVTMWDAIIFNYFKTKKWVLPQKQEEDKFEKYAGAFVKEPVPGMYKWVVSFDLDALYPHLIAQYNISPECLSEIFIPDTYFKTNDDRYNVDALLERKINVSEYLHDENITMAANGHCFTRDREGFLPEILMQMYEDRKAYKRKMIEYEKALELVNDEIKRRKAGQ